MILVDIIVLLILAVPAGIGIYRGFAHMFIHALGWIGALVGGLLLTGIFTRAVQFSFLQELVCQRLSNKFFASADVIETTSKGLPDIISGGLSIGAEDSADIFAELLSSMLVSVISFLFIVFAVRLVLGVVIKPLARRGGLAPLKGADKLLGFVAGLLEGIVLTFVFLTVLVLIESLAGAEFSKALADALEHSVIAGTLYDNNLLMLVTGGIFS